MCSRFSQRFTDHGKRSPDEPQSVRTELSGKQIGQLSILAEQYAAADRAIRDIAKEYRQQGISRSTAPDLRNMTENQFLLEVLSHSDWSKKLQEKEIEVKKPTLELISQKLKMIDPSDLRDYNTAVRNFNETLNKFRSTDLVALRVELAGLRGGIFYGYGRNGQLYARFMTLRDPSGTDHVFKKGETNSGIANFTTCWIKKYASYGASHLTTDNVKALKNGESLQGWTCTELTYHSVEKRVYCTDKGTRIYTLHNLPYEAISKEHDDEKYPGLVHGHVEDPTAAYSCHSLTFLNSKDDWFITENGAIQAILSDHEYQPVVNKNNVQIGDIAVYFLDGAITHTALVKHITDRYIIVDSKLGPGSRKHHEMSASQVVALYGEPTIYHTNREAGHTLLRES